MNRYGAAEVRHPVHRVDLIDIGTVERVERVDRYDEPFVLREGKVASHTQVQGLKAVAPICVSGGQADRSVTGLVSLLAS